ncbi:MAG TPA: metallophosphoesterase [Gemmatimonadaceae bacterium]|nr:metallophosphoesterase [Gemmatimonadaceae bacterium]
MHRATTAVLAAAVAIAACTRDVPTENTQSSARASTTGNPVNTGSKNTYTLAVIGDTPYGPDKLAELPSLVDLMNSDPKVDIVVHLGDIKAGSNSPCTDEYFAMVKGIYDGVADPFVYTPGDNEWTDCHVASKNNGLYTPTERLVAIRNLFFPVPGQTLGGRKKQVLTEADDPQNSAYVENVMWMESQVVFATLNVQGSNDDLASWGTPLPANAANYPTQAQERASRSQANSAWLVKAFQLATDNNAAAVVLAFQADMWDATASLNGFDPIVIQIGNLAKAFGKPVLLLEGDSHAFRIDHPFTAASPLFGLHPNTPIAPNVTRAVVEGSAAGRTEYLRITVSPVKGDLFTFERVPLHP